MSEQVFIDICDELGCPYDNEAALNAIARLREALKDIQRESMRFKPPRYSWFYDRAEAALNQQIKK